VGEQLVATLVRLSFAARGLLVRFLQPRHEIDERSLCTAQFGDVRDQENARAPGERTAGTPRKSMGSAQFVVTQYHARRRRNHRTVGTRLLLFREAAISDFIQRGKPATNGTAVDLSSTMATNGGCDIAMRYEEGPWLVMRRIDSGHVAHLACNDLSWGAPRSCYAKSRAGALGLLLRRVFELGRRTP